MRSPNFVLLTNSVVALGSPKKCDLQQKFSKRLEESEYEGNNKVDETILESRHWENLNVVAWVSRILWLADWILSIKLLCVETLSCFLVSFLTLKLMLKMFLQIWDQQFFISLSRRSI